jgi:ketosteroid isomerase-like protein
LRRWSDALAAGDMERAATELAPDIEIEDRDIPDAAGTDSFQQWMGRWNESWDSWRSEDVETTPIGEVRVLALFRIIVTGKGSGIELERDDALVADFRDAKITRIAYYNDQEQAREAAGMNASDADRATPSSRGEPAS